MELFRSLTRLAPKDQELLEKIAKSPTGQRIVQEADVALVAERREDVEALKKLDRGLPGSRASAEKVVVAARAALEAAEAEVRTKKAAFEKAAAAANAVDFEYLGKRKHHEQRLIATCDPRIRSMWFELGQIRDRDLGQALKFWVHPHPTMLSANEQKYFCNVEAVSAARAKVNEAIAHCNSLMLQALSHSEISQALVAICEELAPILGACELNPPTVTIEGAEVGRPLEWFSAPRWLVTTLPIDSLDIKPDARPKANATVHPAPNGGF